MKWRLWIFFSPSFLPLLVLFYEGNLLFFFLNPIRVEGANIRNRRIKQFGSGHTAFILTWSFFVVVFFLPSLAQPTRAS